MIRNSFGHNAQSHDIRAMLGLSAKAKLPVEGIEPREIQGYTVWVEAVPPKGNPHRMHRVKARCGGCGAIFSAGRTHQHKCQPRVES